jgi:hypothetical protein
MTLRTVLALETELCSIFFRNLKIYDLLLKDKNLRICDLRTGTPKKFADLQFADFKKKKFACPPLIRLLKKYFLKWLYQ